MGQTASAATSTERVPFDVMVRHPEVALDATAKQTLFLRRTADGIVVGYVMTVDSVYCKDEVCTVVPVTMFWDALGTYERLELVTGVPLEKLGVATKGQGIEKRTVRTVRTGLS